ncbi:MAG: YciK family oxidoreductase [Arenicellales bacterium]|nr:YciK family oxidoreductase [Arenicellales bacterium]
MSEDLLNYKPVADLLRGRIILVTGAADGIGRAVSKGFARHGASTILLDRKSRKLETLYDEIVDHRWPEPTLVVQDLNQLDLPRAVEVSAGIEHDFHRLDGLLHNAGYFSALTPMHSIDPDVWQESLQVNLSAPYVLTQALFPLLKKSSSASIIFTSADVGRRGRAYWGAYAVAYGGIETVAQIWADELEQNTNIRVNTLDPGAVQTKMRNLAYPGEVAGSNRTPEDIVNAYLFLMGEDSKHIRGQALTI